MLGLSDSAKGMRSSGRDGVLCCAKESRVEEAEKVILNPSVTTQPSRAQGVTSYRYTKIHCGKLLRPRGACMGFVRCEKSGGLGFVAEEAGATRRHAAKPSLNLFLEDESSGCRGKSYTDKPNCTIIERPPATS